MAKKELTGTVISDKMNKTRVVRVMRKVKHPSYNRVLKTYNTYKFHDEKNESKTGDEVTIGQCRPLSKDKTFRLLAIVKKAHQGPALIEETIQ